MATYNNVVSTAGGTITASTVDTVNFVHRHRTVAVTNTGTTNNIYFTTTGVAPVTTAPSDGTFIVPPGATIVAGCGAPYEPLPNMDATIYSAPNNPVPVTAATQVQLAGSGVTTPSYEVIAQ